MYSSAADVWHGFSKNAQEGLAAPALILPATILLAGGQVLPLVLLSLARTAPSIAFAAAGTCALFLPRLWAIARFRQPILGALLHPLAVCVLLIIQWTAFLRAIRRRPATWKGRVYSPLVRH